MHPYVSYSDQQLLALLREGRELAFTTLYDRYWAEVFRNVMRLVRSQSDAEDIVQELFASIWKRRATLEIKSSLGAYLYASARYICLRYIEKNITAFPQRKALAYALEPAILPSIESQIDANTLEGAIEAIVEQLPEKMREVFRLSRKEQLSYREIAERLGISEGTVKKQVYNSLRIIRKNLAGVVSMGCLIACIYSGSF